MTCDQRRVIPAQQVRARAAPGILHIPSATTGHGKCAPDLMVTRRYHYRTWVPEQESIAVFYERLMGWLQNKRTVDESPFEQRTGSGVNSLIRKPVTLLILLLFLLVASGCRWQTLRDEAGTFVAGGQIVGTVHLAGEVSGPVMLVVCKPVDEDVMQVVRQVAVQPGGRFQVDILPGRYYVGAFHDANHDGLRQDSEIVVFHGRPTPVQIGWRERRRVELSLDPARPASPQERHYRIWPDRAHHENIGRIVSLDDPVFSDFHGPVGLWLPSDYTRFVGSGLYWLEPFATEKIPVLMIHGANGGPGDWIAVLKSLDRHRFAPWFYAYPSGRRLTAVSDDLVQALAYLQARYDIPAVVVVAHSMGGLVARAFILKWRHRYPQQADRIVYLMTVSTPFGGMESARVGVARSPVVVPSWKDVATGSRFLRELALADWPQSVFWDLVYTYQPGSRSDGVVPLESQLPVMAREQASRLTGFQATHAGILSNRSFLAYLNRRLTVLARKYATK